MLMSPLDSSTDSDSIRVWFRLGLSVRVLVLSGHSFAGNWQLPFLNQQKGENGRKKYFMASLHERMLSDARTEPTTVRILGGRASDRATTARQSNIVIKLSGEARELWS